MSVNLEIIRELVKPRNDDLPADVTDWPEDWLYVYEERAAIMEYDGHLTRQEAEQWAETIARAAYSVQNRA